VAAAITAGTTAVSAPKEMTFRQLEDSVQIWLKELEGLEKDFHDQASTINQADSLLINNAYKISQLNDTLEKLKADQANIDRQLDFIIFQQNELEKLLEPLENCKIEGTTDPASSEREFTYSLVESVNNDLQSIGSDLEVFIKKLNDMKSSQDSHDPLNAINKVLNAHMDALMYIETQVQSLKTSIDLS